MKWEKTSQNVRKYKQDTVNGLMIIMMVQLFKMKVLLNITL